MPFALFDQDIRISKAYPTAEQVWKHAYEAGLVVEKRGESSGTLEQSALDGGYEIKPCDPEPTEDPVRNEVEAEWWAERHPFLRRA